MCQNTTRGESQVAGISCLLAQTIILLFTMLCPAQSMPSESLEYVPLRTARNEIQQKEKVLVSRPNRLEFEAADGRVIAEFSVSECDPNGWRVPPGTLMFLSVAPKKRIAIDDVDLTGLVFTMSEGKRFYVNTRAGIEYQFRQDADGRYLDLIRHIPKSTDSSLRCNGFPEYDPLSDHYVVYDREIIPNINRWDAARIYTTSEASRQNSYRAFIFVYCPSRQRRLGNEIIKKINRFVRRAYGTIPENLIIAFGGVRAECQFESFLIRADLPDVRPRPTQSP